MERGEGGEGENGEEMLKIDYTGWSRRATAHQADPGFRHVPVLLCQYGLFN